MGEREKTDGGESARVIHKLSQAYFAAGDAESGRKWERIADQTYQQLMQTGEYTMSSQEPDKWDYLVCLKFR